MAHELRKTGIPLMEEIPWGSHVALFYETQCDLLDTCASYFAAALQGNEFCTWSIPDSVQVDIARRALRNRIPDFDRHQEAGAIELKSVRDLGAPGETFDMKWLIAQLGEKLERALAGGYAGMRAAGQAWAATPIRQSQQFFGDEYEFARALEGQPILAMGTFELGVSRAVDVLDVARVHHLTVARRQGEWQFMETPELKQANAQIRRLNDALAIMSRPFPGHDLLTERERVVLAQIVKGASSKEIARDLGVSPRTVDFHRANILQKMGARNTAEVIGVVLSQA